MIIPTIHLAVVAISAVQVSDEELIDAAALVTRCADAGGVLTLHTDLHVVAGAAQTGACHIILDFSRLVMEGVQLSASGFFVIDGQPGGELRIERSTLAQSNPEGFPVNILLRAHHLTVDSTVVDFDGSIHLETGMGDRGVMHVESTILRSGSEDVKVGASGTFAEGVSEVRSSILLAATDINVTASFRQAGLRRGVVDLEGSSLLAGGSITIQTGDAGQTRVRGNGVLRAAENITITSSSEGQTRVEENRIRGENEVRISSGGFTNASLNIFLGSGDVTIQGPVCESQENIPEVTCIRRAPTEARARNGSSSSWCQQVIWHAARH